MSDNTIKLIVGLGNPGTEYASTRHNAGQILVEELARVYSSPLTINSKFFGYTTKANIANQTVWLLVPTTYMNRSGQAVSALAKFYKISPEEILVAHDELDLPEGRCRLKIDGGHGGHNGLRDIISALGNQKNFARLRIGIDHPGNARLVTNYVLKTAPKEKQQLIDNAIDDAIREIDTIVSGDFEKAMRDLHSRN